MTPDEYVQNDRSRLAACALGVIIDVYLLDIKAIPALFFGTEKKNVPLEK